MTAGTTDAGASGTGPPASPTAAPTALQVLRSLDSGPRGLSEQDAESRLERFGENVPPAQRTVSWPRRLLRSLRDPFTAVLFVLGLVSASVAAWPTAVVITLLVTVSCVLRSSGELRADRSMDHLRDLVTTTASVLRTADGTGTAPVAREVPVSELVPGDVIRLSPGDLVPADVRLLRASGLRVYQAALTGESQPVDKYPVDAPDPHHEGPFTQPHLCFQGSSVASGSGTAVVTATGERTEFARAHVGSEPRGASAFDRSVRGVSWILIRFMLLTPPLVLMANAAVHDRGPETLPFAVAVAVALTPEMLPVVVTTCLARGAGRLSRGHGVIVKRLPALHDLGAVDVLCLDKTGTLTQDRPEVHRAVDADGRDAPGVLRWAAVNSWWTLNLADLPVPDVLDEAILDAVGEGFEGVEGLDSPEDGALGYTPVAALPFDPVRRLSTAVVRTPGRLGSHTLVVKGAVESVLERCALPEERREQLHALAARGAADGFRLLAIATAERPARQRGYTPADERGLTFRGFVLLRDAVADSAAAALRDLAERGVGVKVLTGDHPGTAARTCSDLGLDPGEILTTDRVDALDDAELAAVAERTTVFAGCTPEHKARVVAALRAGGHTTGFLGDGVNDVPALRTADVGLCPRDAVDVARESADVVLAGPDRDLSAIGHAVVAGRHAGGNIAAYLRITLSSNLGNVIAMLAVGTLLPFLPMLPAQVLVQNLCFDAAQLAFAYDRPHPADLRRPAWLRPRDLLRFITGFGALNALADLLTFGLLAVTIHGMHDGGDQSVFHAGWFTENLITQALVMVILHTSYRGAARRGLSPVGWAALLLAAVGILLPLSPVGSLLHMPALPATYYSLLAVILTLYAVALRAAVLRYERRRTPREVSAPA